MIWSRFSFSWILVVTCCSCRKNRASNDTPRFSGGSCCESKKACSLSRSALSTAFMRRASQVELLTRSQPAYVVGDIGTERLRLVELLDLGHDQFGFGRFGVGDVDGEGLPLVDAIQFVGQRIGR